MSWVSEVSVVRIDGISEMYGSVDDLRHRCHLLVERVVDANTSTESEVRRVWTVERPRTSLETSSQPGSEQDLTSFFQSVTGTRRGILLRLDIHPVGDGDWCQGSLPTSTLLAVRHTGRRPPVPWPGLLPNLHLVVS